MNTAVIVIDMQQALCSGPEEAWDIERVTANVNDIVTHARTLGVPVIMIQHEETSGPLQYGTDGWQIFEAVATDPTDLLLQKRSCDSFHNTQLHAFLERHGVHRLVICGLQTDFCVDTTVRRALSLGYDVTLVADAHSTMDNGVLTPPLIVEHHNKVLGSLHNFGPRVEVKSTAEVHLAS
ncbi:MAG TPA: cysteine hydrolase family protein [Ramlibacter sp.]|nr:cysteine hydrolase family protein [Ramlibacter sp.]